MQYLWEVVSIEFERGYGQRSYPSFFLSYPNAQEHFEILQAHEADIIQKNNEKYGFSYTPDTYWKTMAPKRIESTEEKLALAVDKPSTP